MVTSPPREPLLSATGMAPLSFPRCSKSRLVMRYKHSSLLLRPNSSDKPHADSDFDKRSSILKITHLPAPRIVHQSNGP